MSLTGDFAELGRLTSNIRRLATVPSQAAADVSERLQGLIEEEFAEGVDPYGEPWQELADATLAKRTQTTEPPLTDTGEMRATLSARPLRGAGVTITIEHPAAPHQTGWNGPQGSGPPRPIFPNRGLPPTWSEAIASSITEAVERAARGRS